VNFQHQIRYRELQLVQPEFAGLRLRRQPVARSQIEQDVGGLPDHELSVFEERRREGRRSFPRFHHARHRSHAVAKARDVGVAGARLFQREADIFAAALNHWPVIKLVTHRWHLRCRVDRYNKSSRGWFVTPNAVRPCDLRAMNASRGSLQGPNLSECERAC
jgi:hypothetical protein